MELDIKQIETALQKEKQEIDELDVRIKDIHNSANELKPVVQQYNNFKQEEADLRKLHRAKQNVFKIHTGFIQGITGEFPDGGVFPLFSQQNKTAVG